MSDYIVAILPRLAKDCLYRDDEDEDMEEGAGDGKENVKEGKKLASWFSFMVLLGVYVNKFNFLRSCFPLLGPNTFQLFRFRRQNESGRGDEAPSKKQRKDSNGTSSTELLKVCLYTVCWLILVAKVRDLLVHSNPETIQSVVGIAKRCQK